MAKKEKHQAHINTPSKKNTTEYVPETGLLDKLDTWFEKHDKKIFYSLVFFSTLFSLLLFDSKVSAGGDDSSYIERAWLFLNEGKYPYFQGPGYPVFLSLFVKMFGLNVVKLKVSSVLCQLGFVFVTYFTFRKRVPYMVLFALIAFISFNNFFQYYASQTFTETFFLFIQSICLYVTFKIIDSINNESTWLNGFKENYLKWLLFGLMFVVLSISKSIAFVSIFGVVLYFVLNKNFKQAVYAVVAFALLRLVYQLIASALFGPNTSGQLSMMLQKDIYNVGKGYEDFGGMVDRFLNNFNTYFSLHIYRILNPVYKTNYTGLNIVPPLAYITTVMLAVFTFLSYKRNKFIFFSSIYLSVLCGGVFIGVQAANMQDRLIIIAMPLIFIVLFYGVYSLAKRSSLAQYIFVFVASIMLVITIGKSTSLANKNIVALKKNMNGDIYYGYTPDWENFLKMSKYCADSLPDSSQVLSRKPGMSFIYGNGKKFLGQYAVTTTNADSVLTEWKQKNIKYVLLASLRKDPNKNNGLVVNTLHRMMQPIAEKYPQKLKLLKTIGDDELAYLYEIDY
jgi:hypothetical protein